MKHPQSKRVHRRGSTMILVVSMLVLLVIIATVFVSRAQSLRVLSSAQQLTAAQTDRIGPIAHTVSDEIAQSLFVQPVDTSDPALANDQVAIPSASSAIPRIIPNQLQTRFSVDQLDRLNNSTLITQLNGDGIIDGYNFAPYEVRPWTNWPDVYNFSPAGDIRSVEGNPIGNPGFGDCRWLRSTEPVRVIYDSPRPEFPTDLDPHPDITIPPVEVFSHWAHLSWIPTANNGWCLITDISDLCKYTLSSGLTSADICGPVTNPLAPPLVAPSQEPVDFFPTAPKPWALEVPYEQWLPSRPPNPSIWMAQTNEFTKHDPGFEPQGIVSQTPSNLANQFRQLAFGGPSADTTRGWFSSKHSEMLSNSATVLPNFLRLKWFGQKTDEFVPETPRNIISRTLCDSDGDGFTDSFWFLAPTSADRSIRHVVGVSVVDNSALLNVNIATRFDPATTGGKTPSDLALVSRQKPPIITSGITSQEKVPPGNAFLWPEVTNNVKLDPHEVGFLTSILNAGKKTIYPATVPNPVPPTTLDSFIINFDRARFGSPYDAVNPIDNRTNPSILSELGVMTTAAAPIPIPVFPRYLKSDLERINYFKAMSNGGEVEGYFAMNNQLSDQAEMAWGYGQLGNHFVGVTPPNASPVIRTSSQAPSILDPFTMADELELRAFTGQNNPYVRSRLERALGSEFSENGGTTISSYNNQFLRSAMNREETSEYFDQLDGTQLLLDKRRMLTTTSGARNELMPPWLWTMPPEAVNFNVISGPYGPERTWQNSLLLDKFTYCSPNFLARPAPLAAADTVKQFPPGGDANLDGGVNQIDSDIARTQFLKWNRKVDLNRELTGTNRFTFTEQQLDLARDVSKVLRKSLIDSSLDKFSSEAAMAEDGEGTVRSVFSDLQVVATNPPNSWGKPFADMDPDSVAKAGSFTKSRRAVASWTANIIASLDGPKIFNLVGPSGGVSPPEDNPLHPSEGIIVSDYRGDPAGFYADPATWTPKSEKRVDFTEPDRIYIGQEKQPFIVQAFFAVVYPRTGIIPDGTPGSGEGYVNYKDSLLDKARVITVVQIANPYNTPISLAPFHLTVFGANDGTRDFYFDPSRDPRRLIQPQAGGSPLDRYEGWNYGVEPILGPATENGPSTAIVYSIPLEMSIGIARPAQADLVKDSPAPVIAQYSVKHFRTDMLNFLDLSHWLHDPVLNLEQGGVPPYYRFRDERKFALQRTQANGGPISAAPNTSILTAAALYDGNDLFESYSVPFVQPNRIGTSFPDTLLFNATGAALNTTDPPLEQWGARIWSWHPRTCKDWLKANPNRPIVELVRTIPSPRLQTTDSASCTAQVVVDRLENKFSYGVGNESSFRQQMELLFGTDIVPPFLDQGSDQVPPKWVCDPQTSNDFTRTNIGNNHFLVNWLKIARPWTVDVDGNNAITSNERSPRFVFAGIPTVLIDRMNTDNQFPERIVGLSEGQREPMRGSVFALGNYTSSGDPQPLVLKVPDKIIELEITNDYEPNVCRLPFRAINAAGNNRHGIPVSGKPTNFPLRTVLSIDASNRTVRLYPELSANIIDGWPGTPGAALPPNIIWGDTGSGVPVSAILLTDTDCDRLLTTVDNRGIDSDDVDDDNDGFKDIEDLDIDGDGIANQFDQSEADIAIPAFYRYPLRMSQRDGPFEQIAEIYDVPVWGPVVSNIVPIAVIQDPFADPPIQGRNICKWTTIATYGEMMIGKRVAPAAPGFQEGRRLRNFDQDYPLFTAPIFVPINVDPALEPCTEPQMDERETMRFVVNRKAWALLNTGLPAGASLLDGFTLDGAGTSYADGSAAGLLLAEQRRLRLASGFTGAATQGMININTAPVEVLRTLPNCQQLSYNNEAQGLSSQRPVVIMDTRPPDLAPVNGFERSPPNWVRLPESIVNYRELFPSQYDPYFLGTAFLPSYSFPTGPKYADRGQSLLFHNQMRSHRGFASVGELSLIDRVFDPLVPNRQNPESNLNNNIFIEPNPLRSGYRWDRNSSWSISYAGLDPYRVNQLPTPIIPAPPAHTIPSPNPNNGGWSNESQGGGFSAQLATERLASNVFEFDRPSTNALEPLLSAAVVAGDQTERNTMLKGIANIVTTRSDVFTVYLKIRSVAQNPVTGGWDATNPETLIDESRYIMVIDRSNVERPGQEPKILMFEKIVE